MAPDEQRYTKIGEKKQTTLIKELCEGYPGELKQPRGLVVLLLMCPVTRRGVRNLTSIISGNLVLRKRRIMNSCVTRLPK